MRSSFMRVCVESVHCNKMFALFVALFKELAKSHAITRQNAYKNQLQKQK